MFSRKIFLLLSFAAAGFLLLFLAVGSAPETDSHSDPHQAAQLPAKADTQLPPMKTSSSQDTFETELHSPMSSVLPSMAPPKASTAVPSTAQATREQNASVHFVQQEFFYRFAELKTDPIPIEKTLACLSESIQKQAAVGASPRTLEVLFIGHSHVRELLCGILRINAAGDTNPCRNVWQVERTLPSEAKNMTLKVTFLDDVYLQLHGGRGRSVSSGARSSIHELKPTTRYVDRFDLIVAGRGAWDAVYNDTDPDELLQTASKALVELVSWLSSGNPSARLVVYLPHFFHAPTKPAYRPCVTEDRVMALRSSLERAAHVAAEVASRKQAVVSVFDVYELTKLFPRESADAWGHHYIGTAMDIISAAFIKTVLGCETMVESLPGSDDWGSPPLTRVGAPRDSIPHQGNLQRSRLPSCSCDRFPFHDSCPLMTSLYETTAFHKPKDRVMIAAYFMCHPLPREQYKDAKLALAVLVYRLCSGPPLATELVGKGRKIISIPQGAGEVVTCLQAQGRSPDLVKDRDFLQDAPIGRRGLDIGCLCQSKMKLVSQVDAKLGGNGRWIPSAGDIGSVCHDTVAVVSHLLKKKTTINQQLSSFTRDVCHSIINNASIPPDVVAAFPGLDLGTCWSSFAAFARL